MNKFYSADEKLIPHRSTKDSAGYDFISPIDFIIPSHSVSDVIDGKVSVNLDSNKVLLIFVRSSFGFKHGITLTNGTGIIDADFFPNTIKFKFRNDSDEDFVVKAGDKIAQGVIVSFFKTQDDVATAERKGGIGSTGK